MPVIAARSTATPRGVRTYEKGFGWIEIADSFREVGRIDDDRRISRRAQRHVQNRPLFADVDLIPAKHGVDSLLKAPFFGQLNKKQAQLPDIGGGLT